MHIRLPIFIMVKHVRLFLIYLVFSIFSFSICSFAAPQEGVKEQLKKKGFSEEMINILNPLCQENLNRRLPADVIWYATFDHDAKSVTVDFQTKEKAHKSVTVVSLKDGGCLNVLNTIVMTIGACKKESEAWIKSLEKRGVKVNIEDEDKQHIFLGAGGKFGVKVYLYQMGNLCMQVFRNVESIKYPAK
jgi:hypothetical protein